MCEYDDFWFTGCDGCKFFGQSIWFHIFVGEGRVNQPWRGYTTSVQENWPSLPSWNSADCRRGGIGYMITTNNRGTEDGVEVGRRQNAFTKPLESYLKCKIWNRFKEGYYAISTNRAIRLIVPAFCPTIIESLRGLSDWTGYRQIFSRLEKA